MRTLEPMYDAIFQDKRLQELFLNFHSSKWSVLTKEEKMKIMEEINDRVSNIYGYPTPKIVQEPANSTNYGSFGAFNWQLNMNPKMLEEYNGYENIDTYFHELRHSLQHRCVDNELQENEYVDPAYKEKWQRNFLPGNYFDGDNPLYIYQPVEADAWKTGMLFARGVYLLCLKHYKSEDPQWKEYCSLHKNVIVDFISENPESQEDLKKINSRIDEIYNQREIDIEQVNKGKEYIKEYMNKGIENLDINEVGILLSPYAFTYLDTDQKVALLNKYEEYVRVGRRKIKIEKNTLASIKLGSGLYLANSSLDLVNGILSIEFKYIVDYILKGKDIGYKINENAKKEIKLNLYKNENNKKINYIPDLENLFAFSLQPYAKYESNYILKEMFKLKDIELQAYGKNYDSWKVWKDFYDNEKIYKMAEKVMGCNFIDYYKSELKTYQERIKLDKEGKLKYDKEKTSKEIQSSIYDKLHVETKEKKDEQNKKNETR